MTRSANTKFACGPLFLLALMVGTMAMPAQANGAGLLDWLFPRRAERQARRWSRATQAYRPVSSVGYNGTQTSYYGGNFAGGQNFGSGGYYPSYGSWNGWGYQSNANANYYSTYRPTTVYRTQWSPVPVTTYRPTAGGAYQTPSTSYEWQALRVPYTALQPGAASTAPALTGNVAGGSTCAGHAATPTTAGYGGGWQSVSPATVAPATGALTSATTTAGYAADYSNATEWTPVTSGGSGTKSSDWQPAPSSRSVQKPASDVAGATEWRPFGSADKKPTAANTRPRLEDNRRESFYREQVTEFERDRYESAREMEEMRRELEAERRKREMIEEEYRGELRKQLDNQTRQTSVDRYADWDNGWQREDRRRPQTRPITRYDDRYNDNRNESDWAPRPTVQYRPSAPASELDRQRSEYYRRQEASRQQSEERNAYRPMLDDGWSYDKTDNRASNSSDSYDWRTSSNSRSFSTKTEAVPASSLPNHRPRANTTPRGVTPLLLKPIPETDDRWNTQSKENQLKLLGPQDRTAALPKTSRWQAIPVEKTKQLQWRSVAK